MPERCRRLDCMAYLSFMAWLLQTEVVGVSLPDGWLLDKFCVTVDAVDGGGCVGTGTPTAGLLFEASNASSSDIGLWANIMPSVPVKATPMLRRVLETK